MHSAERVLSPIHRPIGPRVSRVPAARPASGGGV